MQTIELQSSTPLGRTVQDQITGFRGVVTGYCLYLTGCHQALVAPPLGPDGALRESAWFDVQRLEVVPDSATLTLDNGKTPGCDRAAPAANVPSSFATKQSAQRALGR